MCCKSIENESGGAAGPQGATGPQGLTGPMGNPGSNGLNGANGINGLNATMSTGVITTGSPGTNVIITNTGTSTNAIWNFTIPRGDTGSAAASADYAFMDILMAESNFGVGNTVIQNTAGMQTARRNTGQNIGDFVKCAFTLPAGTYTLGVFGARVSNSGIWRFNVDQIGPFYDVDMYAAATTQLITFPGTFTVTAGKHFLYATCVGSTPGGTSFYGYFGGFRLI